MSKLTIPVPSLNGWLCHGECAEALTERARARLGREPVLGSLLHVGAELWVDGPDADAQDIPAAVDVLKRRLQADVHALRLRVESGGIVVAGLSVATDRESQGLIQDALAGLQACPDVAPLSWRCADGAWAQVSLEQLQAISTAVFRHVEGCFRVEHEHKETIDALPDEETCMTYDISQGWPA